MFLISNAIANFYRKIIKFSVKKNTTIEKLSTLLTKIIIIHFLGSALDFEYPIYILTILYVQHDNTNNTDSL